MRGGCAQGSLLPTKGKVCGQGCSVPPPEKNEFHFEVVYFGAFGVWISEFEF